MPRSYVFFLIYEKFSTVFGTGQSFVLFEAVNDQTPLKHCFLEAIPCFHLNLNKLINELLS